MEEKKRKRQRTSASDLSDADVEFLRRQQNEALAEVHARTRSSAHTASNAHSQFSSPPRNLGYDSIDSRNGNSIIQQRFDALVCDAILRFGPPLPAEFVAENDVVTHVSAGDKLFSSQHAQDGDSRALYFYDEVPVRPQELFQMIRRVDSSFSVRTHADGVPFSLLIKNCLYLRAFGGKVHFMRWLKRVRCCSGDGVEGVETPGKVVVTLSKYKMRESPSFDGLRQGPQPWLYNYRMI